MLTAYVLATSAHFFLISSEGAVLQFVSYADLDIVKLNDLVLRSYSDLIVEQDHFSKPGGSLNSWML